MAGRPGAWDLRASSYLLIPWQVVISTVIIIIVTDAPQYPLPILLLQKGVDPPSFLLFKHLEANSLLDFVKERISSL